MLRVLPRKKRGVERKKEWGIKLVEKRFCLQINSSSSSSKCWGGPESLRGGGESSRALFVSSVLHCLLKVPRQSYKTPSLLISPIDSGEVYPVPFLNPMGLPPPKFFQLTNLPYVEAISQLTPSFTSLPHIVSFYGSINNNILIS